MAAGRDLSNLDFIRTAAVLMVSVSHLCQLTDHFPWWIHWMGLSGVYIFFVHTSMVLMWSLERDPHTLRFYVRRAFRIYPLWLAVLAGYVVLHWPRPQEFVTAMQPPAHYSAAELLSNAALAFNLNFGDRIVPASWTLPIEMQMYLLLPFLFFFMRATKSVWPVVLLWVYAMICSQVNDGAGHMRLLQMVPCFLPGVVGYYVTARVRPRVPSWIFPIYFLSIGASMAAFAGLRRAWLFCMLIGVTLPFFHQISQPVLKRVTHLIAKYSYGIYLMHFIALTVSVEVLAGRPMLLRVAAGLLLYIVPPVLIYHLVEAPMIKLGSRLAKRLERGPEPKFDERMLSMEPAP